MAIVRCDMGHFYDSGKSSSCPHCESSIGGMDDVKTVSGSVLERMSRAAGPEIVDFGAPKPGDEKTIGIYKKEHGWDPVTGWLVCISGPERGRDYRLHTGRNFLGRAANMDISVSGDPEISRENHCSVVFEPKTQVFLLAPGGANTYLNKRAVTEAQELSSSDVIGAGVSEFVFIPYCSEGRGWGTIGD